MTPRFSIRPAVVTDAPAIAQFIRDLAEFEKLADQCTATAENIARTLFAPNPKAFAVMAEVAGEPAGFALYFYNYSTFLGKYGIYIEDAYVRPEYRSKGIGEALFKHLAKQAVDEGCGRLEWWVLDWNRRAIDFYRRIGAVAMDEWTVQRVEGDALRMLANSV